MTYCLFDKIGDVWRCHECGREVRASVCRNEPEAECKGRPAGLPAKKREPVGSELKKIIAKFGFTPSEQCKCEARAKELDRRGADWAERNLDKIVGWLREEHAAQQSILPFLDVVAKKVVLRAIHNARKEAQRAQ